MASTAKANRSGVVASVISAGGDTMPAERLGPNRALERFAGADDLTAIIMTAMAADMMRALKLPAVAAFGKGFALDRVVATAHSPAGRRRLSLGNGHRRNPFRLN
jgi:hypothetical protein